MGLCGGTASGRHSAYVAGGGAARRGRCMVDILPPRGAYANTFTAALSLHYATTYSGVSCAGISVLPLAAYPPATLPRTARGLAWRDDLSQPWKITPLAAHVGVVNRCAQHTRIESAAPVIEISLSFCRSICLHAHACTYLADNWRERLLTSRRQRAGTVASYGLRAVT